MIEKMKKLSLIIYHSSKDRFLDNLQKLGVIHLETNSSIQNEDIININEKIAKLKKGTKLLTDISKSHKAKIKQINYKGEIEELLEKIDSENEKLSKLKGEHENINKEINLLTPWGTFDPAYIEELEEIGVKFKYYSASASKFEKMDKTNLRLEVISNVKGNVYFVVVYRVGEESGEIDAVEQRIPIRNINELYKESVRCQYDITNQEKQLLDFTKYLDYINSLILENIDRLEYDITDASLVPEAEGKILIIKGWAPERLLKDVKALLEKEDVVYLLEDPSEDDNVPVLLRNGPFARLFEPITKMHSLPQYTEIDPTPFFAPFFAAFFGLCLADVGYGLVLLVSIIGAFLFIKNKKALPIIILGLILSLTTIFFGMTLDSFFGQSNFSKLIEMHLLPPFLKEFLLFGQLEHQMAFAVMLGVIQVILGFILQASNRARIYGFIGCLQPIGTILLLISGVMAVVAGMAPSLEIGPMQVGKIIMSIPNVLTTASIIAIIGVCLVLFFNNVSKKIYIRPFIGLWELYGIATGVPGDILSYLRLFALGLAGGLLGSAFNQIGIMVRGTPPSIMGYIFMALIMVFGHSINIGLAALSAFVHPLRLVLLEFYKSTGYTGGGLPYSPFKYRLNK